MTSRAAREARDVARNERARLLSLRDFDDLAASLGDAEEDEASGEALMGVVQFLAERYEQAAIHFARALELRPGEAEWSELLALSTANAHAEVEVRVPPLEFFDAEALLAPPTVHRLPVP